jgi:hypothetical protein
MLKYIVIATLALSTSHIAQAQSQINVKSDASWVHDRTGTLFPAIFDDMPRKQIMDFGRAEYDVGASYENPATGTFITVYVYLAGLPDVSLWFDRVSFTMLSRSGFQPGEAQAIVPVPFTPPGARQASGIRLAYSLDNGNLHSTGAALLRQGEWLFKIRASSASLGEPELNALIDRTIAAFSNPEKVSGPAAYLVKPCADRLAFKKAKQVKSKEEDIMMAGLMAGLLSGMGKEEQGQEADQPGTAQAEANEPETPWCRDGDNGPQWSMYRHPDDREFYVLAQGDNGNVVSVGRDGLSALLLGDEPTWSVSFASSSSTESYPAFNRLPSPEQAWEAIGKGNPISSNNRDGNITIFAK